MSPSITPPWKEVRRLSVFWYAKFLILFAALSGPVPKGVGDICPKTHRLSTSHFRSQGFRSIGKHKIRNQSLGAKIQLGATAQVTQMPSLKMQNFPQTLLWRPKARLSKVSLKIKVEKKGNTKQSLLFDRSWASLIKASNKQLLAAMQTTLPMLVVCEFCVGSVQLKIF